MSAWIAVADATDAWGPIVPLLLLALTFLVEVVARPGRRLWRWMTRRRRVERALRNLTCEVQLRIFEEELGQPAMFRWDDDDGGSEHLFVLDEVYVQVIVNRSQAVRRYAITRRSEKFAPELQMAGQAIVLGQTTFAELMSDTCMGVAASVSARRGSYAEAYYAGNPGFYQTWVAALNNPGRNGGSEYLMDAMEELDGRVGGVVGLGLFGDVDDELPMCWTSRPAVARFRRAATVNTLGVAGPHQPPDADPGPDMDRVRLLTQRGRKSWWRRALGRQ